ncbi:hypothetical protein DPMN_051483 [Dreissena polymorpha]|uniref:Uncharacterized protein n=1 Tax=Dreissena polymorpha TaxID=45954 RepID=A0A9D4HP09_DREPO|nr:hypothetical protein DPMN_051483 [Dreissena polymorpha]
MVKVYVERIAKIANPLYNRYSSPSCAIGQRLMQTATSLWKNDGGINFSQKTNPKTGVVLNCLQSGEVNLSMGGGAFFSRQGTMWKSSNLKLLSAEA